MVSSTVSEMMGASMDQDQKVRENRLRETAKRRGYTLSKSRRRDPLAIDYGWTLSRGSINGVPTGNVGPFDSLDAVEDFLNAKLGPLEKGGR
jgi:hypothetical protein